MTLMQIGCVLKSQVRLANNQYSMDKNSFFEYETHFTVMVCYDSPST